ncbi:mechanosensitive ion channel family protein [Tianweitania sp. BSSL-BM11]|uniref:Small-conductance mechanosensitive channel n=1 Tax=Tianweitania aestuarii TaxID=2814886 RepID=A0ABS5RQ85_9HYPH|nr:mechanosensitive ion channel family protein [Tianweitania aestuarii]MBS9719199.1 mechanosensitive ion channel family protein [Tianweitania aestuarii]
MPVSVYALMQQAAPAAVQTMQQAAPQGGATVPPDAPETVSQAVNLDPAFILGKVETWVIGFQRLLPNIAVALVVLVVFVLAGWLVRRSFRGWAKTHDRDNLGEVLGSFLRWIVIAAGTLIALTIVIPSLRPGDLVAGLGIGSVAIGFAFKDILQNWLAGLLLLIRQPFRPGDQIVVKDYEGTVQRIETRATIIKTYDGRSAIIPNADVYSNAVVVNTAHETRRSDYDVGIGYGDSIDDARAAILKAVNGIEGVEANPAPEALVWDLAASTVNLRVRWWTNSVRTDVVHVKAQVLEAIKKALDAAGIDMPFDTQVMLVHDQTDENDGIRGKQREGWPKKQDADAPRPVRLLREEKQAQG